MAKFTGKGAQFLINTATAPPQVYVPAGQVQDAGDYRDYIQGFKDPGECELTVIFDPGLPNHDDSANGLIGLFDSGEVRDCAIRWNSSGAGGEAFGLFKAFIRDMTYGALNAGDPQTITPLFRITTPIALADALPTTLTTPESLEELRKQEAELQRRRDALAAEEEALRQRRQTLPASESGQPMAA